MTFADALHPAVATALGTIAAVTFLPCWVIALKAWLQLLGFRCPRCGGRFVFSWSSSLPTDRCKLCGLDLAPGGRAGFLTHLEEGLRKRWM